MNLLRFFFADVRNSRGKFDEIKEKFAINPAPIASQSSLNAGDHDELEIFLKIRLIPSRIDQKLKKKRRSTWVFKKRMGPKIVGNWHGCGSGFSASRVRSHRHGSWLEFRDDSASI